MAPAAVDKASDVKKAAAVILESVNLDSDQYRLGHTKACTPKIPVVRRLKHAEEILLIKNLFSKIERMAKYIEQYR